MSWKDRLPELFRVIIDHDNKLTDLIRGNPIPLLEVKKSKARRIELTLAAEKYIESAKNPEGRMK